MSVTPNSGSFSYRDYFEGRSLEDIFYGLFGEFENAVEDTGNEELNARCEQRGLLASVLNDMLPYTPRMSGEIAIDYLLREGFTFDHELSRIYELYLHAWEIKQQLLTQSGATNVIISHVEIKNNSLLLTGEWYRG